MSADGANTNISFGDFVKQLAVTDGGMTSLVLVGLFGVCLVGAAIVALLLFFKRVGQKARIASREPRKKLRGNWQSVWAKVHDRWAAPPVDAAYEMGPYGTLPEEPRQAYWRSRVLANLSRNRNAGEPSRPPSYESTIEPPRPAVTKDDDRYIGLMV